jgi:hypothetical protein
MSRLFATLAAAASLAVLGTGPVLAQEDHSQHHPATAAAATPLLPETADADGMHARCKAKMGAKMEGKAPHDHGKDKTGAATLAPKPMTPAEMEAMHAKCAARMKAETADAPKPK